MRLSSYGTRQKPEHDIEEANRLLVQWSIAQSLVFIFWSRMIAAGEHDGAAESPTSRRR